MSVDGPGRFVPPGSAAGTPFWEASREPRFVLPWCTACGRPHWFPREACPHCLSDAIEWRGGAGAPGGRPVSGVPKPGKPALAGRARHPAVELPEGVRMMGEVRADDPWSVVVDDPVTLAWEPLGDGRHLPVWDRR